MTFSGSGLYITAVLIGCCCPLNQHIQIIIRKTETDLLTSFTSKPARWLSFFLVFDYPNNEFEMMEFMQNNHWQIQEVCYCLKKCPELSFQTLKSFLIISHTCCRALFDNVSIIIRFQNIRPANSTTSISTDHCTFPTIHRGSCSIVFRLDKIRIHVQICEASLNSSRVSMTLPQVKRPSWWDELTDRWC